MKNKRPSVKVDWKELYSILIAQFRQLNKLTIGPLDRLQSREYQFLTEKVKELQANDDLSDRALLSAFLMYEWPQLLAQGISLMQEIPNIPTRVLEIGSGTAPFALAALMSGSLEAFTLHNNPLALKVAGEICGRYGYPISVREHDPRLTREWPLEGTWDLIIIGYSLTELFPTLEKQVSFISNLFNKVNPGGHILLVDSSQNEINRHFLHLRDAFIKEGISIQAPCIWQGGCPALSHGASPCYSQRPFEKPFLINDIQKSIKANTNSLKMTYFLLCPPGQKNSHPQGERLYRVVSPPIETFKGTRHFLCGVDGKKTLGSRLTSHPKSSKAYEYLKKGDVVSINNAIELEDDLIIAEETSFVLKSPFDKPLQ
jgi:ribosomal protein RSM22 (predicted rRNA methylase)